MMFTVNRRRRTSANRRYLAYLFAFLLIITMQTVYVKIYNTSWDVVLNAFLVLVSMVLVARDGRLIVEPLTAKVICVQAVIFTLIPVLQLLFLGSVNFQALFLVSALCIVLFSVCVIYIREIGIRFFLDDLASLIYVVTVISFVLYLFGQVLHIIHPSGSITIEWGGARVIDNYYFLLFVPQGESYHAFVNGRYSGIYTEPPMCAYMICVALIIMLFISEKKIKYGRIVLLCVAVFFTVSTTGWIVCTLCIGFHLLFLKPKTKLCSSIRMVFIPILIIAAIYTVISLYQRKQVSDVGSVSVRNDNFVSAIDNFFDSPLFGLGFKSDAIGVTQGNTSVISNVLQQGGFLFFVWYFLPIICSFILFVLRKKWRYVIATGLYMMLLYATVVTYTAFSIAMIAVFTVVLINENYESYKYIFGRQPERKIK